MSRPRKYPQELLERGTRLVLESGRPVAQVARDLGVPAESLRPEIGESDISTVCVHSPLSVPGAASCSPRLGPEPTIGESPQRGSGLSSGSHRS